MGRGRAHTAVVASTLWAIGAAWYLRQTRVNHFVPAGAPGALAPALAVIEVARVIIRPITLSVRLIANLAVGHVICSLLRLILTRRGSQLILYRYTFYILVEVGVACIQAYIFCLLLRLYLEEQ